MDVSIAVHVFGVLKIAIICFYSSLLSIECFITHSFNMFYPIQGCSYDYEIGHVRLR